jgi:hypothetical protein
MRHETRRAFENCPRTVLAAFGVPALALSDGESVTECFTRRRCRGNVVYPVSDTWQLYLERN